ncbi:MAG: hypothetical protein WC553_02615 [Patescibacteria group bacterium]
MLPKLLSWKTGLVAVAAVTAVWASVPDSMVQNSLVDGLKAWSAKGRWVELSDNQPLNGRKPVVVVLGLNGSTDVDGPTEEALKTTMALPLMTCQGVYRDRTGRELYSDSKWYGYWYNSKFSDLQIAGWLEDKLESDPDLTSGKTKSEFVGHSKGGKVLRRYWGETGGRKTDAVLTLATPHMGCELADKATAEQGIGKAFPYTGKILASLVSWMAGYLGIDFNAEGVKWLRVDYPPAMESYKEYSLTSDWYLLGGTIDVSDEGSIQRNLDLLLAGDQLFTRATNAGAVQDAAYYRATGLALDRLGAGPSDGIVSLDSALSRDSKHFRGYAEDANTIVIPMHNHSEMLQDNGGTELWMTVMDILIPRILPPQSKVDNFDLWLPELPDDIKLPSYSSGTTLADARLVFANQQGEIWVRSDSQESLTQLRLGSGQFSWPQWLNNDLILTRAQTGRSDIIAVQSDDGRVVQLTIDGKSSLAGVSDDGKWIAFVSDGNLMLRDKAGMAKILVTGPMELDSPPVLIGEQVYFAIKQGSGYSLYSVNVADKEVPLEATKSVAVGVSQPMKIGTGLLALKPVGDKTQLVVVSVFGLGLFNQKLNSVLEVFDQSTIPSISAMDIDSRGLGQSWADFNVYLVSGDQIRRLKMDLVAQSQSQLVKVTWETLAPPVAPGIQLDVK